jgi:hypothetical protein
MSTDLRKDVVLKALPRIIKKYFIADFKKYIVSKKLGKAKDHVFTIDNVSSYVKNLSNFKMKYSHKTFIEIGGPVEEELLN